MSKHFLVVGGTSGIGAALLARLVKQGHRVTQLSRHPDRAAEHPLVASGRWDAGTEPFPAELLPAALDGLAYCPGTIRLRPFERLTEEEWREDLNLNLMGAVRAIQGSLKSLRQAETAGVLLFSSVAAGVGLPYHASIAAAKGAVEALTRALAAELAPRIRVNAIAPTVTATPLAERLLATPEKRAAAANRHPLKMIGAPEDLARTGVWLLDAARLTTGQVLHLDAGLSSLRV